MTRLIAPFLLLLLAGVPSGAQIFSREEIVFLVGSGKSATPGQPKVEGAITRTQVFYHYFKRDRDASLKIPKWVEQTLEAMLKRPVCRIPMRESSTRPSCGRRRCRCCMSSSSSSARACRPQTAAN